MLSSYPSGGTGRWLENGNQAPLLELHLVSPKLKRAILTHVHNFWKTLFRLFSAAVSKMNSTTSAICFPAAPQCSCLVWKRFCSFTRKVYQKCQKIFLEIEHQLLPGSSCYLLVNIFHSWNIWNMIAACIFIMHCPILIENKTYYIRYKIYNI